MKIYIVGNFKINIFIHINILIFEEIIINLNIKIFTFNKY